MKSLIILFCLFSFSAFAADTTIVKLMQKVITSSVLPDYKYFYLLDKASTPHIERFDFDLDHKTMSSIPLIDLIEKIKSDTTSFNWSSQNLPRARCVDKSHLPKHVWRMVRITTTIISNDRSYAKKFNERNNDTIVVYAPKNATQKATDRAVKKATAAHNAYCDRLNALLPIEERNYFIFSKPIFSTDKQYAYIEVSRTDGGVRYLFKNTGDDWIILYDNRIAY